MLSPPVEKIFLVLTVFLPSIIANEQDYDMPISITLFHSLDSDLEDNFVQRGVININSQYIVGNYDTFKSIKQLPLEDSQLSQLKKLAQKNGLYRLKAIIKTASGKESSLLTYTKACLLLESNLSDVFIVSLDANYDVVAVSVATIKPTCENNFESISNSDFNTTIAFRKADSGPVPDATTFIAKMEKEREAREKGGPKDNRSFLAKYWMYIVPAAIFVLLSGAVGPDVPQQGQQR